MIMKKILTTAAVALAVTFAAGTAQAAALVSNVAYTAQPSGPYVDLATSTRFSNGTFVTGSSSGNYAQPAGSGTDLYWSIGTSNNGINPGFLDVTGLSKISFLWGSVDNYNSIDFLDAGNNILESLGGSLVGPPANGDQDDAATNRYVTLDLTQVSGVTKLQFNSTQNAFETAHYLFTNAGVPEPSTWALMILGIGAVGFSMRRSRDKVTVRYA
jgi:hypothetical protein